VGGDWGEVPSEDYYPAPTSDQAHLWIASLPICIPATFPKRNTTCATQKTT
jgi:hypothetical protein